MQLTSLVLFYYVTNPMFYLRHKATGTCRLPKSIHYAVEAAL